MKKKHTGNKTMRNTFSWLIGYDFGNDGYYNGCYYDEYTKSKSILMQSKRETEC